ncbi:nuclease-related domain-containing protein [Arthrobacter sp. 260]|uniref:nuclease-related domain-containing protein n=1 Tax=Arthrobacter sp. 260 TaxID=2735314 RepID=UPI0014931B4B|nr:nuclease-related domain-containing protein [Arthrobacter sp. 260]NOJ60030.1 NERD domain-containing protein [Arthrobacter sp. 260]
MTAGAGAAEQARLAAERVTRLKSELAQAHETVLRLQQQVQHAERAHRAWNAGAAGELLVADRLALLAGEGWLTLHDLHWPGRPKANLDHLLVGPGGVLIIDAKNWSGEVQLRRGELTQNGAVRSKESASALDQAGAIAALLEPQHRQLVQTWLCLVGQPDLKVVTASGVRVEGLNTIEASVRALPKVLEPEFVTAIHHYLRQLLGGEKSPMLLTTAGLGSEDGAASMLQHRRLASGRTRSQLPDRSATSAGADRPRNTRPPRRKPQRSKKKPGCLSVSVQLAGLGLVLVFLVNVIGGFGPSGVVVPQPTPTVSQPADSTDAG